VGALSLLAFCVQLMLAAPAAAVPFTGGFSPTIIGERADLNGDGVVNGRDDANAFYGDTHIIDGMLDCNAWGVTVNSGAAGNGVIAANDDCTLVGYDGTALGVTIQVSGGEFQVADGRLPTVFNAADPDNPDVGDSDFAWSAIGGRVDSNGDEAISGDDCHFGLIGATVDVGLGDATDGADVLGNPGANECGFSQPPAGANNGFVDLNSDTVITGVPDSCAGCFFGLGVVLGLVQAPAPTVITLEPAVDTNTVGTDHTVTATVTDQFDDPVPGEDVHFAVTGGGTPVPASGDDTTDASGEATFTFTNETAGANTITACVDADGDLSCDVGELSDTATKTWVPGPAVAIALEPAADTNPVGSDHTVTATVEDEFGNPVAGEDVHFAVSGGGTPVPASGDDTTDASGLATFTFTNGTAGTNTITACIDADGQSDCDAGEAATPPRRRGRFHRRRLRVRASRAIRGIRSSEPQGPTCWSGLPAATLSAAWAGTMCSAGSAGTTSSSEEGAPTWPKAARALTRRAAAPAATSFAAGTATTACSAKAGTTRSLASAAMTS
jgi:hypothetical protein